MRLPEGYPACDWASGLEGVIVGKRNRLFLVIDSVIDRYKSENLLVWSPRASLTSLSALTSDIAPFVQDIFPD